METIELSACHLREPGDARDARPTRCGLRRCQHERGTTGSCGIQSAASRSRRFVVRRRRILDVDFEVDRPAEFVSSLLRWPTDTTARSPGPARLTPGADVPPRGFSFAGEVLFAVFGDLVAPVAFL